MSSANDVVGQQREIVQGLLQDQMEEVWPTAYTLGDQKLFTLLAATSAAVVYKLWPEDPSPNDLPGIARRISAQVTGEGAVPPALVEVAIRGALGEHDLLKDLPSKELIPAYLLLIKTGVHTVLKEKVDRDVLAAEVLEALEG